MVYMIIIYDVSFGTWSFLLEHKRNTYPELKKLMNGVRKHQSFLDLVKNQAER